MNGETALQNPAGLDYLHYIHRWEFAAKNATITNTSMNGYVNVEFSDLDTDVAKINGTQNLTARWDYYSVDSNVTAIFDMDITASDIAIQQVPNYGWSSGCPTSGTVEMQLNASYSVNTGFGPDLTVKIWDCDVTFDMGVATVQLKSENKIWTYTREICVPVE
jgi:hypothetical protein